MWARREHFVDLRDSAYHEKLDCRSLQKVLNHSGLGFCVNAHLPWSNFSIPHIFAKSSTRRRSEDPMARSCLAIVILLRWILSVEIINLLRIHYLILDFRCLLPCHHMPLHVISFRSRTEHRNFWSVKRRLAPSHSKVNTVCRLTCAKIAVSMDRHHNYSNVKAIDRPIVIVAPSNVLRMEDAWRKMCAALMTRAVQQLWWSTTR
jgi:hypothetical protein